MATKKKKSTTVDAIRFQRETIQVRVTGISNLVLHRFDDKSKEQILAKQMGASVPKREARDPEREVYFARYLVGFDELHYKRTGELLLKPTKCKLWEEIKTGVSQEPALPAVDCVPVTAVKNAMVSACRLFHGVTMTAAKQIIHVNRGAAYIPIEVEPGVYYGEGHKDFVRPIGREDVIRLPNKSADLRFRPVYTPWSLDITIDYVANVYTAEQVVNLLEAAGFSVGIGENRPEKSGGSWGTFTTAGSEAAASAAE